MSFDLNGSSLELQQQQLEAALAQHEAQVNQTRARLAQLKQSTARSNASGIPSVNTAFQLSGATTTTQDGQPVHPQGSPMALGDLAQPALCQPGSFTAPTMQRVRTCQPGLQHSVSGPATKMARSKSSYATSNPFTAGRGSVRPVPVPVPQGALSMDNVAGRAEQYPPSSTSMFAQPMDSYMGLPDHHHGRVLDPVMEHGHMGTFEDPGAFLQRMDVGMNIPRNTPICPIYEHDSYQPFTSQDLPSSQCGSLSSGPTISDASMTRSNSNVNQSTPSLQMMRFDSQSAFSDNTSSPEYGYSSEQQSSPSKKRSAPDDDLLGMSSMSPTVPFPNYAAVPMGRSTSIDSRLSSGRSQPMSRASTNLQRHRSLHSRPMQRAESQMSRQSFNGAVQAAATQRDETMMRTISTGSDNSIQAQQAAIVQSEPMARTASASSAKSTQSQRERGKEALKRHNTHAEMQPLAPKPKIDSISPASANADAKAGADGKVAMPRSSGYQRPKRPKISCDLCDEHPDGFRGEHELRRHKDLKHSKDNKRFVCRTPAQLGLGSDFQPITPLEKCKHCMNNKEYGQYYNAAAHLRRAHFKEKPPRQSRAKNGTANANEEPRQKRGGMGGGDYPPMGELKAKWMEEIKSTKPTNDSATISDDDVQQDMEMYDQPMPSYQDARDEFDDITTSYVGSNTNLQVQNNDVYTDSFNDLNYTTSSLEANYDPSRMMTATGSASFDFNSPINPAHAYYPPDLSSIDPSFNNQLQSPNNSTSTATMTPFNSYPQLDAQYAQQKVNQPMMGQLSQPNHFEEMDFGLVMGAQYEDASLHQN